MTTVLAPMPYPRVHALTLHCHPTTPNAAVRGIEARLCGMPAGNIAVTYRLDAELDRLRMPAPCPPRIADRLWQHMCFETFVRLEDLPAYHEFNFSPSGEWAAYAFERYRMGSPLIDEALNPQVIVRNAAGHFELDALIRLDRLSATHSPARLSLALSAVIEDNDGSLSYWALAHPPGTPDFHHPDAFALELDEVRG